MLISFGTPIKAVICIGGLCSYDHIAYFTDTFTRQKFKEVGFVSVSSVIFNKI